ncbi:LPXTG cell wall anchor domain-containing protein, partial [Gemella morbillorum]|uniref:LPXTG cell wall anchor domain-containing protein n=1 Tax=Gemella morbillorum TaxID=29391 RepID=UPI0028D5C0F7
KPNTDKPNTDKPNTDKPNTDKPNTDKPNTDKPNTDKPNTDKPAVTKQFFEDKKIGVQVELIGNSPATKLEAKEINDNQLAQNILTKLNLPNSNVRILELKLLDKDNNTVNSNAKRKVSITLKEGEKDVAVYHVKEDGSLELIKSQINGNILTFEIDHFSKFALVSENKKDSNQISTNRKLLSNTGSQTVNSQLFGALILVLGGVLYLANKKRRN